MQGTRSQNRKPPLVNWQPTVPAWEKKFCTLVGSVPWKKLLETKRFMYFYENVVNWNDSAAEEAFNNAKTRFWAKMNGLPCNISPPDPDMHIDVIDWDSEIDPELLSDLERYPKSIDMDEYKDENNRVILGNPLLSNQWWSCKGWGDDEDNLHKSNVNMNNGEDYWAEHPVQSRDATKENSWENNWNESFGQNVCENNWSNYPVRSKEVTLENKMENYGNNSSSWKKKNSISNHNLSAEAKKQNEMKNYWNESSGGNTLDNNYNKWDGINYGEHQGSGYRKKGEDWGKVEDWGKYDGSRWKKEGSGLYTTTTTSRFKTTRFHGNDYQTGRGWRKGRGRDAVWT